MSNRTAIVLGAGIGGVTAAIRLKRHLPGSHRVILVDRGSTHLYQPSLLWVTVGKRDTQSIQRPLDRLRRRGVDIVRGDVIDLDPDRRRVRIGNEDLTGDALVIALGAGLQPERIPGLSDGGFNLYTAEGATRAWDSLQHFRRGRVVVVTAAPHYKCPAAPYEAAMLVSDFLERRGLAGETRVEMFSAEPGPMRTAGLDVSDAVRVMVESRRIAYHPGRQIEAVEPRTRTLRFEDRSSERYDLLLYVPPHASPAVVRTSGMAGDGGWISVDPETLATRSPGVFAIGDVAGIKLPSGGMLPKAGVFAHKEAHVVARNVAQEWLGGRPSAAFDGRGACFIETGGGRAAYGTGNFFASPAPDMKVHRPARHWRWAKVLNEKRWLLSLGPAAGSP